MARPPGQAIEVNGRSLYVEQSGQGDAWVVFVAGAGQGRTGWDRVVPLLADQARLVAFDRAGRGQSERTSQRLSIDGMADDLVGLLEIMVPGGAPLVLVGHSMGGLVVRRAAERLPHRLDGVLLVDPTPETAPAYDHFDKTAGRVTRIFAFGRGLFRLRPVARLLTRSLQRLYSDQTYQTMLAEDFTPAGLAQTGRELTAVAECIQDFRARPPAAPDCPIVVLSATQDQRRGEPRRELIEHQRRFVDALPQARLVPVDSDHLIPARQPAVVADHVRGLLVDPRRTDSP